MQRSSTGIETSGFTVTEKQITKACRAIVSKEKPNSQIINVTVDCITTHVEPLNEKNSENNLNLRVH